MESWRKELYHHGIKGQQWGVRNGPPYPLRPGAKKTKTRRSIGRKTASASVSVKRTAGAVKSARNSKTKDGGGKDPQKSLKVLSRSNEPSELHEEAVPVTAKFLAKFIPAVRRNIDAYHDYKIRNKEGRVIGNFSTNKDSQEELNIVWMGINSKYEGKGYAQSAMRLMIGDARKEGFKYLTLEVPTNSPNARHIYEKYGFKDTGEAMLGDEDDVWGGLTKMRLKL